MLKCCGCDNVNLQHSSWCSEDMEVDGSAAISVTYFPPAISKAEPSWLTQLDGDFDSNRRYIVALIREIYSALHNDSRKLAVMGVRALLEHVMISTVGDHGTFEKNLENFQVQGYLSGKQRKSIESILQAGHATMHRQFSPSTNDVNIIVDIAESLIATTYVHADKADELDKRVPKKKKNKKKSGKTK